MIVVAAAGNINSNAIDYPAGYSDDLTIGVGGIDVFGDRFYDGVSGSNYGNGLDVVAPYGNLSTARLSYTAYGRLNGTDKFQPFHGTSAAAPYVSGLVALLHAEKIERSYQWTEPEDFQGMIKASCWYTKTGQLSPDYNEELGWGHINAGRIFEMLEDGYDLHHFESEETDLVYGPWEDAPNGGKMIFVRGQLYDVPIKGQGVHLAQRRRVTAQIPIPVSQFDISNDSKAYVWGRSGPGTDGGWSAASPNFQRPYTKIIDGNTGSDIKSANGLFFDGSNGNDKVVVENWQYRVTTLQGVPLGDFPATDKLKHKITLFAKSRATSVGVQVYTSSSSVYPNPTTDRVTFRSPSFEDGEEVHFQIFDRVGRKISSVTMQYSSNGNSIILPPELSSPGLYVLYAFSNRASCASPFSVN